MGARPVVSLSGSELRESPQHKLRVFEVCEDGVGPVRREVFGAADATGNEVTKEVIDLYDKTIGTAPAAAPAKPATLAPPAAPKPAAPKPAAPPAAAPAK